jgi:hypothetical protein
MESRPLLSTLLVECADLYGPILRLPDWMDRWAILGVSSLVTVSVCSQGAVDLNLPAKRRKVWIARAPTPVRSTHTGKLVAAREG